MIIAMVNKQQLMVNKKRFYAYDVFFEMNYFK